MRTMLSIQFDNETTFNFKILDLSITPESNIPIVLFWKLINDISPGLYEALNKEGEFEDLTLERYEKYLHIDSESQIYLEIYCNHESWSITDRQEANLYVAKSKER